MSTWGTPTEGELDSVLEELTGRHPDLVHAAESIYGVSHEDRSSFRQVIKHAMSEGGIRRADGQRWGLNQRAQGIFVEPKTTDRSSHPDKSPMEMSSEAVVTGCDSIPFYPEPFVQSYVFLSPGAHVKILDIKEKKKEKWTHIILDDGQEGWLKGEPQPADGSGPTNRFAYQDTRAFFLTRREPTPRIGFLLHWAHVLTGKTQTSGGTLENINFVSSDWGTFQFLRAW